jgi:hypothetical protein
MSRTSPSGGKTDITPETKVAKLLESYPELESVLLDMSPAFAKLKNPILRKTVTRVATLQQIAEVGGVPLAKLINALRQAAGIREAYAGEQAEPGRQASAPEWARPDRVTRSYDARPAIQSGGRPIEKVLSDLAQLAPGEVYELITPFVPSPLIEAALKKGIRVSREQTDPEIVKTYFYRE